MDKNLSDSIGLGFYGQPLRGCFLFFSSKLILKVQRKIPSQRRTHKERGTKNEKKRKKRIGNVIDTGDDTDSISTSGGCLQEQLRIQQVRGMQRSNKGRHGHWILAGKDRIWYF